MRNNAGYTIQDGWQVQIPAANGDYVGFEVEGSVVVPPGSTATAAGAVTLVAIEPGTAGNGLSGTPQLVDAVGDSAGPYVSTIALVGSTAGGLDAEDPEVFDDRLASELQLATPMPLTAADCAILARRVSPVYRAVGVDNYDPSDGTYGHPFTMAVACIDVAGAAVSAPVKAAVKAMLEDMRGQNYVINVFDPTITAVDVQYAGKSATGWDPTDVTTRVDEAIAAYLSPATWGQPVGGDQVGWEDQLVVRIYELAEVINRVDGFNYLTSLQIRIGAGTYAAADVTIPGPAALATVGAIGGAKVTA